MRQIDSILRRGYSLLLALLIAPATVNAQLLFSAPPRETAEAGEKLYAPLVQHLRALLGTDVRYEHPKNWLNYQKEMREGKYDIVFDGAHFTSWRMVHLEHEPILKLPTPYQIVIYTWKDQEKINTTKDLIGARVCGLGPPNLVTMLFFNQFPNPARQPIFVPVKGGQKGIYEAFKRGECQASTNRAHFYTKKIPTEQQRKLKLLYASKVISNQAISVSPRVSLDQRTLMRRSLSSDPVGISATRPILDRFAKEATAMVESGRADYQGYNKLLEGVVFGW